jgi:hypothetical protein
MTPPCPNRHYRTARYARRMAFSGWPDQATRPEPVPCECGCGAWRLDETPSTTPTTNDLES